MAEVQSDVIGGAVWDCPDLANECFCHLDVRSLCTASAVCSKWHALAGSEEVWRAQLDALCGPSLPLALPEHRRGTTRGLWKRLLQSTRQLADSWALRSPLPAEGVAWSSQAGDCSIDWTLCDEFFWSSEPSEDPEREEFLTFRLSQPLCIVTGAEVLPATLRRVYAPRHLQVDVGFDETQFHFSSRAERVEAEPAPHRLRFPPRALVVGDHVRLRFQGMQEALAEGPPPNGGGELFCTAIQRVQILGIPIGLVSDNLLAEALVAHALQDRNFRSAVARSLKPPVGEELQVEEIVAGFRAQLGIKTPLWHITDEGSPYGASNDFMAWHASPSRRRNLPQVRLGRA